MTDGLDGRLLAEMVREEWRMHARLFGGLRFAAFPLVIAALVGVTTWLLVRTGTDLGSVLAGLHVLVLLLGLQTGTVGLVGQDLMRNLLGDVTTTLSAARTLPVGHRRLLGLFVVKDLAYYAVLFLLPVALGLLPAVLGPSQLIAGLPALLQLGSAWVGLVLTFLLGLGLMLVGIGLASRGLPGPLVASGLIGALAGAWWLGVDLVAWTPIVLTENPSLARGGLVAALAGGFAVLGAWLIDTEAKTPARRAEPAFDRWRGLVRDPVATKSLLDLHRSHGGLAKVLFSGGVLFVVSAGLFELASRVTGLTPSAGIAFGAILGLTSFTTYNWLTQLDDLDSYLAVPLDVQDVLRGKARAMLWIGPPSALALYAIALAWWRTGWLDALVGALLVVGVSGYILGLTIRMAGLSPNKFLFDAPRFAAFSLAMMVPMVPILVAGLVLSPPSSSLAYGLAGLSLAMLMAGYGFYRWGLSYWARREDHR